MDTHHDSYIGLFRSCVSLLFLMLVVGLNACASPPAPAHSSQPIRIGISLSLSGDFSDDSLLFQQGYELWAKTVNQHGGLLGRPVQLDMLSDASSPAQVQTNYQKLITVNHDDLVFGPFSSALSIPASTIANRYGYAMVEGAGIGPSVFNRGLHTIFCVSLPATQYLVSFADYILSLPAQTRPKTAVYASADDPFATPQVQIIERLLEKKGIKTVGNISWPAETTDYTPVAQKIIDTGGQLVVLGTTAVQDSIALTQAFKTQHYNPQALIEASGPDQVAQFRKAIGAPDGIFVPNSWWPGVQATGNAQMVHDYVAQYGGSPATVSSDVAQAYSVGQVMQQAIEHLHSLDNQTIITYLHSLGATFHTVQGIVQFDQTGQNTAALAYLFQWQHGELLPVYPDSVAQAIPMFPKPTW